MSERASKRISTVERASEAKQANGANERLSTLRVDFIIILPTVDPNLEVAFIEHVVVDDSKPKLIPNGIVKQRLRCMNSRNWLIDYQEYSTKEARSLFIDSGIGMVKSSHTLSLSLSLSLSLCLDDRALCTREKMNASRFW